jgi:ERCC4-type nuclease
LRIIVDSREKKWQHIQAWFDKNGVEHVVRKLDEGDYQMEGRPTITVDRKRDLTEMYACLANDKSRFMREVRRCYDKHIKLYLLIEHGGQIKSLPDVAQWQPKYGSICGREIMERLYRLHISYGVEILFCDKRTTARRILEILSV